MSTPNATPAPLTMTPERERAFEHDEEHGDDTAAMLLAEVRATRAKLAEAESRYAARGEYLAAAVRDKQAAEARVAALTEALGSVRAALVHGSRSMALDTLDAALSPSQDAKEAKP